MSIGALQLLATPTVLNDARCATVQYSCVVRAPPRAERSGNETDGWPRGRAKAGRYVVGVPARQAHHVTAHLPRHAKAQEEPRPSGARSGKISRSRGPEMQIRGMRRVPPHKSTKQLANHRPQCRANHRREESGQASNEASPQPSVRADKIK